MPRISESDFVVRHQAQRIDATVAAQDPALARVNIVAADVDHNGSIEGDPELRQVYAKLFSLDASASTSAGVDLDAPQVKPVYNALTARFVQRTGTEAPLGNNASLASVPELAAVVQGVSTLSRKANVKQLGVGSLQDALLIVAAADAARTGQASPLVVNLGVQNANRGLFGPGTEGAVRALQAQARLPVNGVVDEATLQALDVRLAAARAPVVPPSSTLTNARFANDAGLADVAAGHVTLSPGAHGPSVVAVQQALLDMGFNLWALQNDVGVSNVDGAYGDQTKTALGNFQVHVKLPRTGVLDAATLAALDKLSPAPGAKAWDAGQPNHAPIPSWGGRALRVVAVEDEHRTFLFDKTGVCTGIFADAVGAPGANTTTGLKIVNAKLDEAATKSTGVQLWNDPRAFGQRIVDLNWADGRHSGEELHGTYNYKDLGKDVSHGCVRHRNEDIVTIYSAVSVGELVAIVASSDDPSLHR